MLLDASADGAQSVVSGGLLHAAMYFLYCPASLWVLGVSTRIQIHSAPPTWPLPRVSLLVL
jgi:hypothetical protein